MAKGATLALKITGDASGGLRALDDAEGKAGRFGDTFSKMGMVAAGGVAAAGVALVGLGKQSFDAASDLQQSSGAIETVFGDLADAMKYNASEASTAVGLTTSEYENMATVIGSQLKNAGMDTGKAFDYTYDLIGKGADMAAVFGGTAADAVDALSSALKGEMDPIERYGVSLNQNAIQAEMAAEHTDKLTGAAATQAKTSAVLALINKQTAETTGQWAAQSGTAAEAQQILHAKITDVEAKIGGALLPAFAGLASWLSDKVIPAVSGLFDQGQPLGGMFQQLGGFITGGLVPAVMGLWNELAPKLLPIFHDVGAIITNVVVPAFRTIGDFIQNYAVPVFKNVLGPVLSGVASVWHSLSEALDRNKGKFQEIYDKIKPFLDFLKNDVAPFVGTVLKASFEVFGKVLGTVIDAIAWILGKAASVVGFIGKVGGFLFGGGGGGGGKAKPVGAGRLLGASAGGGLFGAVSSLGGGAGPSATGGPALAAAGDTINITVTGALDPVAVADQIAAMLDRRARRTGLALAGAVR
jgi:phage-related protein